jgi:hypothetical protein
VCPPCEGRSPFRFQRYTWDASVDASFVLPSFYSVHYGGLYNYNGYNGFSNFGYNGYGYGSTGTFSNARSTSILVRHNETVMNRTNVPVRRGAYRFALVLSGTQQNQQNDSVLIGSSIGYNFLIPVANSYNSIGLSVGYEWQEQLGRFQVFYGYSGGISRSRSKQTVQVYSSTTPERSTHTIYDNYMGIGLSPLAGAKFFVHPRFSLSLESTFSISYFQRTHNTLIPNQFFTTEKFRSNGFSYNFVPISAFNATFHFGSVVQQ